MFISPSPYSQPLHYFLWLLFLHNFFLHFQFPLLSFCWIGLSVAKAYKPKSDQFSVLKELTVKYNSISLKSIYKYYDVFVYFKNIYWMTARYESPIFFSGKRNDCFPLWIYSIVFPSQIYNRLWVEGNIQCYCTNKYTIANWLSDIKK